MSASAITVEPHHTLLDVLRADLGLTGTKECCLVGECGACAVLIDDRSVDACLVLAAEMDGVRITTVEGLAVDGALSPLQRAFLDTSAAQCGFCTSGPARLRAGRLLDRVPHPTRADVEEGLAGNYCRCAGYEQIFEAVLAAVERCRAGAARSPAQNLIRWRPDAEVAPQ